MMIKAIVDVPIMIVSTAVIDSAIDLPLYPSSAGIDSTDRRQPDRDPEDAVEDVGHLFSHLLASHLWNEIVQALHQSRIWSRS